MGRGGTHIGGNPFALVPGGLALRDRPGWLTTPHSRSHFAELTLVRDRALRFQGYSINKWCFLWTNLILNISRICVMYYFFLCMDKSCSAKRVLWGRFCECRVAVRLWWRCGLMVHPLHYARTKRFYAFVQMRCMQKNLGLIMRTPFWCISGDLTREH